MMKWDKSPEYKPLQSWLLKYAPDFCWMQAIDLLAMYEIDFPDCSENSFRIVLWRMAKRGLFLTRVMPGAVSAWNKRGGLHPKQYLRITPGRTIPPGAVL